MASPDVAAGFELAGVEVHTSNDPAETEKLLRGMTAESEYGLLIVAEELMSALPPRFREEMERRTVPLVVAVPMPIAPSREALGRKFVSDMIRQAIGYQIQV